MLVRALRRGPPIPPLLMQTANVHHHKERNNLELYIGMRRSNPQKANRNTHVNEKRFRRLRALKTLVLDLPDDVEIRERQKMLPSDLRIALLRKGINPFKDITPRIWNEHQVTLQSFYGVIDPYINPKHVVRTDNTVSSPSVTERTKEVITDRWHTFTGTRRIRKKEGLEKFDVKKFPEVAQDIYVRAHQALVARDTAQLHKLITEHAFGKMWPDVEQGNISWQLIRFNEPSKVVSVRCADNPNKSGNDIAQIIVRFNSAQKLAVYDRFGKLILGDELEEKDVVEFVVFENHVAVQDSQWRLHDKVYPEGVAPKQAPIGADVRLKSLPDDTVSRPLASKHLKSRMTERIKEELKKDGDDDK